MTNLFRSTIPLLVLLLGLLMINCAGTPDANPVQKAQNEYEQIAADTVVIRNAPVALKKAGEAVENAKKSMESGNNSVSVDEQAKFALQRVEIARKTAELKTAQDEVQRASKELQILKNEIRQNELDEMEAEERVKQLINFRAQQTNRGIILRFVEISFGREKSYLKSSAERPINELADFLDAYPERIAVIEGHTDNTGSASFNKNLSQQRANAVRDALISRGVDGGRIQAVGLGEQYPRASNDTERGRQYNRRVEVIISGKSGKIPDRQ